MPKPEMPINPYVNIEDNETWQEGADVYREWMIGELEELKKDWKPIKHNDDIYILYADVKKSINGLIGEIKQKD